jgi:hypothetical protein
LTSHHLTWGKRDFGHGDGIAPVSVLLAVFLTEAWRIMALLSEKLRDRIRDQGRAEASSDWRKWFDRYEEARRNEKLRDRIRNQGRAEASSDWRKWFDRYEEARGVPFNEPPPDKG